LGMVCYGEKDQMGTKLEWFESVQCRVCEEYKLNDAQLRPFNRFVKPLKSAMEGSRVNEVGENPPGCDQQILYLGGPGGTGKSRVIHAIKARFQRSGWRNQFLVSATTGTGAIHYRFNTRIGMSQDGGY
jgi:chromosomal replication initiation ATPase DnaA